MDQNGELNKPTAFVVEFDSPSPVRRSLPSKRIKHMRNLSLPITGVYNSQVEKVDEPSISTAGVLPRCLGYHSEGYFSSDQEDDSSRSCLQNVNPNGFGREDSRELSPMDECAVPMGDTNNNGDNESDTLSDTGTYTIDRETTEVNHARKSIGKVFGVLDVDFDHHSETSESSNSWVNEWASRLSTQNKPTPSPVQECKPIVSPKSPQRFNRHSRKEDDTALETTSYLRTTESVVCAMTARMTQSLSLDSGDDSSDISDTAGLVIKTRLAPATTETASIQTRPNRAFSLRRARLGPDKDVTVNNEDRKKGPVLATEPVVRQPRKGSIDSPRNTNSASPKSASPKKFNPSTGSPRTARNEAFSRTDCGRFSMRTPRSAIPPSGLPKKEVVAPKSGKKVPGMGSGARSNSTLSSREVEFQNWKRRKSYDPMKSAAEGKKKDTKKTVAATPKASSLGIGHTPSISSTSHSTIASALPTGPTSIANTVGTNLAPGPLPSPIVSPSNHVLRSASFHGTHGMLPPYDGVCDSEEEEDDDDLDHETQPLATCSSPLHPSSSENANQTMDKLVMTALSSLSQKLKGSSSSLLKKLRYLYDDASLAAVRLDTQIDLLDEVDHTPSASPQHRSPSKELSATLRNLKRLEGALQVLDEVLFEDDDVLLQ